MISEAVSERERYSASVELLEIVSGFLDYQNMRFSPRNVQNPPVDRLVDLQPAQSLLMYALNVKVVCFLIKTPMLIVPLT